MMLGIDFGVLPWEPKDVLKTCTECYGAAREAIADYDEFLSVAMSKLKKNLQKDEIWVVQSKGASREQLDSAAGFLRNHPKHGKYFAVKPEHFEKWVASEFAPKLASRHLRSEGHLITANSHVDTKQVKIAQFDKKRKLRYYCIKANFLDA